MVIKEFYRTREDGVNLYRSYSDEGFQIQKVGTDEVYDEAIEINPTFSLAYQERGRVKLAKGDKVGSMEDMKRAIELSPARGAAISGEYKNYEQQQRNIPF